MYAFMWSAFVVLSKFFCYFEGCLNKLNNLNASIQVNNHYDSFCWVGGNLSKNNVNILLLCSSNCHSFIWGKASPFPLYPWRWSILIVEMAHDLYHQSRDHYMILSILILNCFLFLLFQLPCWTIDDIKISPVIYPCSHFGFWIPKSGSWMKIQFHQHTSMEIACIFFLDK